MNIVAIFASGSGSRFKSDIPKQFVDVNGKPILVRTIELFQKHELIDKICVAVSSEYIDYTKDLINKYNLNKVFDVIVGGATAQDTIYSLLKRIEKDYNKKDIVLLHDGVRPIVDSEVITNNIEGVLKNGNAITSIPCYETIIESKDFSKIDYVPIRKESFIAQAPQSFYLEDIIKAHELIRNSNNKYENMVDACTICKVLNIDTYMVQGNRGNIKITTPEDLYIYKTLLKFKEDK